MKLDLQEQILKLVRQRGHVASIELAERFCWTRQAALQRLRQLEVLGVLQSGLPASPSGRRPTRVFSLAEPVHARARTVWDLPERSPWPL